MDGIDGLIGKLGIRVEKFICEKHGELSVFRLPGTAGCPECLMDRSKAAEQAAWLERKQQQLVRISGVPPRFEKAGLREFRELSESAKAVKQSIGIHIQQIKVSPRKWMPLILSGLPGTGKTHLLCALINNLIHGGVGCHYTTLQAMLSEIKRSYDDDKLTEAGQIWKFVGNFDLLVIDEIDVMRASDNDLTLLFAVVNGRYNEMRSIAIATNQPPERIGEFLSERIADRLRENAAILRCDWESQRTNRR